MVSLFNYLQSYFTCLTIFNPETARMPAISDPRPDDVDNLIGRLRNVGSGGSFRPRGMRMKNTQEVEAMGFDPIERFELFMGIHYEAHGTLRLIPYPDDFPHVVVHACQQAACLQWKVFINILEHFLPMPSTYGKLSNHLIE